MYPFLSYQADRAVIAGFTTSLMLETGLVTKLPKLLFNHAAGSDAIGNPPRHLKLP
jgi:hypothetical protein